MTEDHGAAGVVAGLYEGHPRTPRRSASGEEVILTTDILPIRLDPTSNVMNRLAREREDEPTQAPDGRMAHISEFPIQVMEIFFRFAAAPEIGLVHFASASRCCFQGAQAAVCTAASMESAQWELRLKRKILTTRSGLAVSYTRPLLAITSEARPAL
ncbi:hypothetical protein ACFYXF_47140 [Streptomyces sp. NPDC002680]|uniref:hypothetical protein n=1 Tax=Streptomyces sp. NPDC002680 TaxID=3364659 RepID=UPI0036C550DE